MRKKEYSVVKQEFEKYGYKLLDETYVDNSTKMTCVDDDGYFYFINYNNFREILIRNNGRLRVFGTGNKYTLNNLKKWIKDNDRPFSLISDEYINDQATNLIFHCNRDDCGSEWNACLTSILYTKTGCPYCSNKRINNKNNFGVNHPNLLKQWDYSKNTVSPFEISPKSGRKIWWICDVCGHNWQATPHMRVRVECGCPACSGNVVTEKNNLEILYPDIARQWNYEKNNGVLPSQILSKTGKKYWWICEEGHEWKATPNSRTGLGVGCPICGNEIMVKSRRLGIANSNKSISFTHPEILKIWNWKKNKEVNPNEYTFGSEKTVWWICPHGHQDYSARICDVTRNVNSCPLCNETNGEMSIKKFLLDKSLDYMYQYKIDSCRDKKLLSFDFVIKIKNELILVEYQGQQHYEPVKFGGKSDESAKNRYEIQIYHDQIKRNYCKQNGIKLLEIPYWEFNNIEQILEDYLLHP